MVHQALLPVPLSLRLPSSLEIPPAVAERQRHEAAGEECPAGLLRFCFPPPAAPSPHPAVITSSFVRAALALPEILLQ